VLSLVHDHDLGYTVSLLPHERRFTLDVRAFIGVEAELGSLKAIQVRMFHLLSNIDQSVDSQKLL